MSGKNLTREEAMQRSSHIVVKSYDVILNLTKGDKTFNSVTTIKFDSSTMQDTFVDLIAEKVNSIVLNGEKLELSAYNDCRIYLKNIAAQNRIDLLTLTICYMHTGEGLHRFVDNADNEAYVYSQFEVADSRRVFAVFEQPDLANFTFTVTTPKHWVAFSNSITETG